MCASRTIYGTTLPSVHKSCEEFAADLGASLIFEQSNHEGVLVEMIQSARTTADAIIVNPAGYSFTSIAIYDALKTFAGPIIPETAVQQRHRPSG